ncbi:immunoglobulin-like domain-containing protein [Marinobacter iranensis]|uniref:immunoglobulin-like domain-containing protein n=1 Tax=Marinobacter iranensis TaxID=2962607 RepID=UPI0023DA7813|nr:immunoglobulin-like domain-containing protein [Marinobacter iranensis]
MANDGALEFGYTGAFTSGPDLTVPASLTEGETATITLSGNTNPPTAARLNGTVVVLTDVGAGDFTFPVPRLPDDPTAELQVDVDGYTVAAITDYENLFPLANTEHGEPHELSALYQVTLDTLQPFEIRIASDTDPAIMTVGWAQIDADGAWLEDISPYITLASGVESGTSTATIDIYRHEQGDVVTRTVTIEDLGPNGTVTIDDINASRNAATISFSYDRADLTGYEYSLDGGATLVTTSNPAELTGLESATTYSFWIRAVNADGPGTWTKIEFTTDAGVDTTPAPFSFTAQTGVARAITVTSNTITVTGVDAGTDIPISVSGDLGSQYSVSTDGGATFGGWTDTPTNVRLNYRVRVRHTTSDEYSSGGYDGVRETTLTIGGVTGTFTSTTLADTIPPVISLTGGNQSIVQDTTWVEPGYEAVDNADGDISVSGVEVIGTVDTSVLGQQQILYRATDASGNVAESTRTVTVVEFVPDDTTAPVIQLTGGNRTVTVGDTWIDPGYTATDDTDGDLTDQVAVSGVVDTSTPGSYPITYTVSDAAGNESVATRIVTVLSATPYPLTENAPAARTFEGKRVLRFEAGEPIFILQSGETLDFDFDLSSWLTEQGDDIAEGTHQIAEIADALDVLASGTIPGTDRIKVWLRAGQVQSSQSSLVQLTVTTTGFRTAVFQFRALIINRMQ